MKTLKRLSLVCFVIMFCIPAGWGQGFVTPLSSLSGDAQLTTVNMETINGKITAALIGMKGLVSLTIKDHNGNKHRMKAAQIQNLRTKIDGLAKLEMLNEKTKNLERLFEADFSEITDRKYAYYEQVKVRGKDRYVLTQLLNPGFNKKIRVYDKPGAKTGETSVNGIAVSGGSAKAYYVKKGGKTYEITRLKYRKGQFKELFGDCPGMIRFYRVPEFAMFAEHVLYYQMNCR